MKKAMVILLLLALVPSLSAQGSKGIKAFGGDEVTERGETRILYWNEATNGPAGEFVIHFGRPEWKVEYSNAGKFDEMTKGKVWRVGKNFWTTLDTNLPLRIGGEIVEPGNYYLGVLRSKDGNDWTLALIDPAAVRENRNDAFEIEKANVAQKAPLQLTKLDSPVTKLEIVFEKDNSKINRAMLVIKWGEYQLSTPVVASLR